MRNLELSVAATGQSVPLGHAGGGGQRRHTAQHREGWFAADPGRVITEGHQQLPGGLDADAAGGKQLRCELADQGVDEGVEAARTAVTSPGGTRSGWASASRTARR
jgi:hypothetical protein